MIDSQKKRASDKRYRERHKLAIAAYMKAYRLRKLSKDSDWDRRRNQVRVTYKKAWDKAYRQRTREKRRMQAQEWRDKHREKWRVANNERSRRFAQRRPDRVREIKNANRAKRKAAPGKLSYGIIPALRRVQRNQCAYCQAPLGPYHVDHIHPLSRGGTHTDENIQLLCPRCNLKKSNKLPATQATAVRTALLAGPA
jgi:5-methylcytosine-specific restriction endonuclease McrA